MKKNKIMIDPRNARKHGERNKETIRASLEKCGDQSLFCFFSCRLLRCVYFFAAPITNALSPNGTRK